MRGVACSQKIDLGGSRIHHDLNMVVVEVGLVYPRFHTVDISYLCNGCVYRIPFTIVEIVDWAAVDLHRVCAVRVHPLYTVHSTWLKSLIFGLLCRLST